MLIAKLNRFEPLKQKLHLYDLREEGVYENEGYIVLVFKISGLNGDFRYLFITKQENFKYLYNHHDVSDRDNSAYWVTECDADVIFSQMSLTESKTNG